MFSPTSLGPLRHRVWRLATRPGAAVRVLPVVLVALMVNVPTASGADADDPLGITGNVSYRQRSALPPGAIIHVRLKDGSRVSPVSAAAATLEGVNWQLIELDGIAIADAPGTRGGDLTFDGERKRIVASGGCNRLTGSYVRKAETLTIVPDASTMMGCPRPLEDREAALVGALRATTAFRLRAERLELRDRDHVVARFQAPSR